MRETEDRQRGVLTKDERRRIELEESVENLAKYLDDWIKIPVVGWRFGLDALIGLVPNVGDTLTSFASFYILYTGVRYGVPKITLLRMAFNVGLDYVVGIVPFVGDAFDFVWKANKQNLNLIRERGQGKDTGTAGDYLFVFAVIGVLILVLIGSIAASLYILGSVFYELGKWLGL